MKGKFKQHLDIERLKIESTKLLGHVVFWEVAKKEKPEIKSILK